MPGGCVAAVASSAHPDGVAVQCLACPTFNGKGKVGEPRLYKCGPSCANHFVSRHQRSTNHKQSWPAFFERTLRVAPRVEALPTARPASAPPLTHLDVMTQDFEITASALACRRCGHQGTFNASTTPGPSCPTSRRRVVSAAAVRVAVKRCSQLFVVPESVTQRRAVVLRFPHGAAVRTRQPDGTYRRRARAVVMMVRPSWTASELLCVRQLIYPSYLLRRSVLLCHAAE